MFPIKEYPGHAKFRGLIKSFVRSNNNENMMMETNFGGGFYEVEFEDGDVEKMSLEEVKACTWYYSVNLIFFFFLCVSYVTHSNTKNNRYTSYRYVIDR